MEWLKRNLGLVISGVIALALLGLAGYFLWMKKAKADEVSAQLTEKTEELKRIYSRKPGVSQENIAAGKEEAKKAEQHLTELKRFFGPPPYPTNLTQRSFGDLLDTTVGELRRGATNAGVTIPSSFQFGFSSPAKAVNIPTNQLETLGIHLVEIESICHVLFNAKVNALDTIKRPGVLSDETGFGAGSLGDVITTANVKPSTNDWTIVTPYEVTFKGFSGDLARVLAGLVKSSNCIVVRDLVVERADAAPRDETTMNTTGSGDPAAMSNPMARYGGMFMRGMPPGLAARYGMRPPMPQQPVAQPAQPAARPGRPQTVQDEKLLRILLTLETVRVKPPGTPTSKPARSPAAPTAADPGAEAAAPAAETGTDSAEQ